MIGRIIAAIAFLVGGAFTWVVLVILKGFGASQAGMSAGPVPALPATEMLIPFLAASYFVTSAIGVLFCRRRETMRVAALVAHSLLLLTFLAICAGDAGGPSDKFLTGLLTLSFITLVYFCPWFIIWAIFLTREASPAKPGTMPSNAIAEPSDNSGVEGGPPSVS